jgi:hypothetical protein
MRMKMDRRKNRGLFSSKLETDPMEEHGTGDEE